MIDAKTAIQTALSYFQELMLTPAPNGSILLEEVELVEGPNPQWQITFSTPGQSALSMIPGRDRAYKTITIDAETGEFRSMKIRSLPVPA